MTPSGIEPATFRFVAQHLNHRAITMGNNFLGMKQIELVPETERNKSNVQEEERVCG
jgi:hypothetical protein